MKELIIETLKKMIKDREQQNKHPAHILYVELEKELPGIKNQVLKSTLRELWETKAIQAGRTINNTYIKIS